MAASSSLSVKDVEKVPYCMSPGTHKDATSQRVMGKSSRHSSDHMCITGKSPSFQQVGCI